MSDVIKVLPSDLWFEILRRISAADLLPLKAVCKTFHLLISSDFFARLHLKDFIKDPKAKRAMIMSRNPTPSHPNYYYDPEKRTIYLGYDEARFNDWCSHVWSTAFGSPLPRINGHRVIDSYHGLLLIEIIDRLLLCNPITRSYKFLPSGFTSDFACWKVAYDDVSKQYKVFGLRIWRNRVSLYVFDVHREGESYLPREITTAMKGGSQIMTYLKESVLVNGNVYWLITTKEKEILDGETRWKTGSYIVSTNITTEEVMTRSCSSTPFIPRLLMRMDNANFFAANGTFYFGRNIFPNKLQLWVLKGVESTNPNPSWMNKYPDPITSTLSTPYFKGPFLGAFRDKILIMAMRNHYAHQLCQYDLSREKFEEVMLARDCNIIGNGERIFESFRIVEHIDSLISVGPTKEGRAVERSILKPEFPWALFRRLYCNMALEIIPYSMLFTVAIFFLFLLDKML